MKKICDMEKIKKTQFSYGVAPLLIIVLLQFGLMNPAKADFVNGGFEDPYSPSGTITSDPINGWTVTGYTFPGNLTNAIPTSLSGINLTSATTPGGITEIYDATNPSFPNDYFLLGATPTPTLTLPGSGSKSASINVRSGYAQLALSRTGGAGAPSASWAQTPNRATSVSQQITIQASDFDPVDNKVHIRFIAAPVVENPAHQVRQQPFFVFQVNNITTGRTGSNPLFFQWNFANQPGGPWKSLTAAGTNPGSAGNYQYTDWQSFDISPGNAFIRVGDIVEVVVLASGCSLGGHEGHVYLDDVQTNIPAGLWITATGPASTTPGSTVTYTYTYTNSGSTPVSNVSVVANLPLGTPPISGGGFIGPITAAQNTAYVSNTNPTTGGSCSGNAPVTCSMGTLQPGQTGTFTISYSIPNTWVTTPNTTDTSGPVNNGNYSINGTGVATLLGPLVQTNLVAPTALSNLVANTSGMPTTAVAGTPYSGSFTCSNVSTLSAIADAPTATCDITNLPPGLAVTGCTISPSGAAWVQPDTIPANQTVTCNVAGTPTTNGAFSATVTTNAANNSNSTSNTALAPITLGGTGGADMVAASSLPTVASINGPYTGEFTCTNNSAVTATSVSCSISGLPEGVTVSSCRSPTQNPWVNGSSLAAGQAVTCKVSGTPLRTGTVTAIVSTSASNQSDTSNDTATIVIEVSDRPLVPATLNGKRVFNPAIACCGRPVKLNNLPGPGKTTYRITERTGNVRCVLRRIKSKTFLKINGSRGSCTVEGSKNGVTTLPLTIRAVRAPRPQ